MVLRKSIVVFFVLLSGIFYSCEEKTKKTQENINKTNVLDTKHFLENDGVQLVLPENFERYSSAKYEALLKDLIKGKELELEQKRLSHLRKIDGSHYIYFNDKTKSTITINTLPHKPLSKEDAKNILSDIVRDQNEIKRITNKEFTKISANYSEITSAQIFKSYFKITDKKKKTNRFQHIYYISSKDKYLVIDVNSSTEIDFDTYLEKLKF